MKINVFENKNFENSFYAFDINPITGESVFTSVYFPRGYKVKPENIKTAKNGNRYTTCEAERKISKSGKVYYQVVAD